MIVFSLFTNFAFGASAADKICNNLSTLKSALEESNMRAATSQISNVENTCRALPHLPNMRMPWGESLKDYVKGQIDDKWDTMLKQFDTGACTWDDAGANTQCGDYAGTMNWYRFDQAAAVCARTLECTAITCMDKQCVNRVTDYGRNGKTVSPERCCTIRKGTPSHSANGERCFVRKKGTCSASKGIRPTTTCEWRFVGPRMGTQSSSGLWTVAGTTHLDKPAALSKCDQLGVKCKKVLCGCTCPPGVDINSGWKQCDCNTPAPGSCSLYGSTHTTVNVRVMSWDKVCTTSGGTWRPATDGIKLLLTPKPVAVPNAAPAVVVPAAGTTINDARTSKPSYVKPNCDPASHPAYCDLRVYKFSKQKCDSKKGNGSWWSKCCGSDDFSKQRGFTMSDADRDDLYDCNRYESGYKPAPSPIYVTDLVGDCPGCVNVPSGVNAPSFQAFNPFGRRRGERGVEAGKRLIRNELSMGEEDES